MTTLELAAGLPEREVPPGRVITLKNGTCPPERYGRGLAVSTPEGLIIPDNDLIRVQGLRGLYRANNYEEPFASTNMIGVAAYSPQEQAFYVHMMRGTAAVRRDGFVTANIVDILMAPVHTALEQELEGAAESTIKVSILTADYGRVFYNSYSGIKEAKRDAAREVGQLITLLRKAIAEAFHTEPENLRLGKHKIYREEPSDYTIFFNTDGQIDGRIEPHLG